MYVIKYGFAYCPVAKILLVRKPEATQRTMTTARRDRPKARRQGVFCSGFERVSSSLVNEYEEGMRGERGERGAICACRDKVIPELSGVYAVG